MRKIRKLGLFDSGLGGYTVYKDLKEHFPMLSLTLYADQKHAPVGNRSNEEIIEIAMQAMRWFESMGIYDVLLACNTMSAVALSKLNHTFKHMRIWGIIDLTMSSIPQHAQHVAVAATSATVSSHAYSKAYYQQHLGDIAEIAITDLVVAIETLQSQEVIDGIVSEALKNIGNRSHLILGCTHFPLVKDSFIKATTAELVDSIEPVRQFVKERYENAGLPSHRVFTSGDPVGMQSQIEQLFNIHEEVFQA